MSPMERTLQQIVDDGDDDEICRLFEDWDYISSKRLPGSVARLALVVGDATNDADAVVPAIAECRADGVDWACIAEPLGLPTEQARRRYEPLLPPPGSIPPTVNQLLDAGDYDELVRRFEEQSRKAGRTVSGPLYRLELAVHFPVSNVGDAERNVAEAVALCRADGVDWDCLAERLGATPAQVQEWFEALRSKPAGRSA
ncbi:MAG: hypothetical protein OXE75_00255 [bacterium]|nr:hypothetical protein [bacterium]